MSKSAPWGLPWVENAQNVINFSYPQTMYTWSRVQTCTKLFDLSSMQTHTHTHTHTHTGTCKWLHNTLLRTSAQGLSEKRTDWWQTCSCTMKTPLVAKTITVIRRYITTFLSDTDISYNNTGFNTWQLWPPVTAILQRITTHILS